MKDGNKDMKRTVPIIALAILSCLAAHAQNPADTTLTVSVATSLGEADLEKMNGLDLRSRFIGQFPGLEVIEHAGSTLWTTSNIGSPWLSTNMITFASKGWSSISCYIDGFQAPFGQFLFEPSQLERVTFVTDVSDKASIGPLASTGAICFETKQGAYDTPMQIQVNAETGIGFVDRIPEWSDGVTYARLNNEARLAAGYQPLYSDEALEGFAKGDMYDRTYPNVDYKSLILRDWKPINRVGVNVFGGTHQIKYNFGLTGLSDGDLFKVGPPTGYNKLNLTSSVTARIGRYIEARASFLGLVAFRQGNRTNLFNYRSVPAIAFPVALGRSLGQTDVDGDKEGTMIYAVSRTFTGNPYAATVEGGFYTDRWRSAMFNADLKVDLSWLLPGLASRTHVNFGSFYFHSVGKTNDYLAYYWDPADDITDLSGHLGTKQASKSTLSSSSYQALMLQQDLTYGFHKGNHDFKARATYYQSDAARSGNSSYERMQMGIGQVDWSYAGRYAANVTVNYAGGSPYAPGVRFAFFPTAGFTWVASEEPFLKGAAGLDRLRFFLQGGQIGYSDIFESHHLYEGSYSLGGSATYGPATAYQWFGSDKQTVDYTSIARIANPNLTWPKILEFDGGFQAEFLKHFSVGLKGYLINRTGMHANTMSEYIATYGWNGIAYYENYTAKRTIGGELSLGYHRHFGDFSFGIDAWATSWKTVNTRVVNDDWLYEWQKATGRDESAYVGYVCIGKFLTEEDLADKPKLDANGTYFGDLMYEDLNGDGVIDVNDRKVIGNTCPRLRYALNIDLAWRDLKLTVTGVGRALYDVTLTGGYFWNGWGDGNYSQFVIDNIGGDYPRLSYLQSTTNFVGSTFWLRRGAYFKVKSAQLSYTLHPKGKVVKDVAFTLTGGNLLTLSGMPYVDPEDAAAGVSNYPFYKMVTAGVKVNF